jgi:hypothetical protein
MIQLLVAEKFKNLVNEFEYNKHSKSIHSYTSTNHGLLSFEQCSFVQRHQQWIYVDSGKYKLPWLQ